MLGELGAEIELRRYFNEKPTPEEIRSLAALLPGGVQDLVSTRSVRYKALALANQSLTEEQWVQLLAQEPGLWRRPIAVRGNQVVIGFDANALTALVQGLEGK